MDFDKVLNELEMEEEELKKLVSAGEIKAFREADKMRFKREDIEKLRKKSDGPDVIELLDSDDGIEPDSDLTEELTFDEDFGTDNSGKEFVEEELSEMADEEEVLELGGMDDGDVSDTSFTTREKQRIRGRSKIAAMSEEEEEDTPSWTVAVMAFSTVVCILGFLVMLDIATATPTAFTGWLVEMFPVK